MKKQIMILIALLLVFTLALTACGKAEPTEEPSTVNLPVVDVGSQGPGEPEIIAIDPLVEAYPISEQAAAPVYDPALAYPIDKQNPNYDAQMEAYLTEILEGKHDIEFLLAQDLTAEQWHEILTNANHAHLALNPGPMDAIIEWLISK